MSKPIGPLVAGVIRNTINETKSLPAPPPIATPPPSPTRPSKGVGVWFAMVSTAAIFDARVTHGEIRVLSAMAAFARRETRLFYGHQTTLARRLGVPRQSVYRWIKGLIAKGYLAYRGKRRRSDGTRGPNIYRLEYPLAQQLQPEPDMYEADGQ